MPRAPLTAITSHSTASPSRCFRTLSSFVTEPAETFAVRSVMWRCTSARRIAASCIVPTARPSTTMCPVKSAQNQNEDNIDAIDREAIREEILKWLGVDGGCIRPVTVDDDVLMKLICGCLPISRLTTLPASRASASNPTLLEQAHVERVTDDEARERFGIVYAGNKTGIVFPIFTFEASIRNARRPSGRHLRPYGQVASWRRKRSLPRQQKQREK